MDYETGEIFQSTEVIATCLDLSDDRRSEIDTEVAEIRAMFKGGNNEQV
jgi:hypothetical protein